MIAVAIAVPALGLAGRASLILLLIALHTGRVRAVGGALTRARWLLVALSIAALLPHLIAGSGFSLVLMGMVGAQLLPLLILITAVTVWVAPYPSDVLSAAVALALRPLRLVGLDPTRPATILAGTLAAIPGTLARVEAVRAAGSGRLDALVQLVLDAEQEPASQTASLVPLRPVGSGALFAAAGWSILLAVLLALGV